MTDELPRRRGRKRMGLDPTLPTPQRDLVVRLRELHDHAGAPSVRDLSTALQCSKSVIADILNGSKFPDLTDLTTVVVHLGGDVADFEWRWKLAYRRLRDSGYPRLRRRLSSQSRNVIEEIDAKIREIQRQITSSQVVHLAQLPEPTSLTPIQRQSLETLTEELPTASPSWSNLSNYLMLVVQAFDPQPFPEYRSRDISLDFEVLPRLAGLATVTGLPEWRWLAEVIDDIYIETAGCTYMPMDEEGEQTPAEHELWAQIKESDAERRTVLANSGLQLAKLGADTIYTDAAIPPKAIRIMQPCDFEPPDRTLSFSGNLAEISFVYLLIGVVLLLFGVLAPPESMTRLDGLMLWVGFVAVASGHLFKLQRRLPRQPASERPWEESTPPVDL